MRNVILTVAASVLLCGCGGAARPTTKPATRLAPYYLEVGDVEVTLPIAGRAVALGQLPDHAITLNVTEVGTVVLNRIDRFQDSEGNDEYDLSTAARVEAYLTRRAKEDRAAVGPANKDGSLRSVIVLRVDEGTRFEKTYAVIKASRQAGYDKFQWRASRGVDGEGLLPLADTKSGEEPDVEFLARALAEEGRLAKIVLRGEGLPEAGLDLKTGIDAFGKKLAELAEKNKGKRLALRLEIGETMLQGDVVKLIDAAIGAGITDVRAVPLNAKNKG
jgi:biopolymer transport protein ExbD